MVAEAPVTADQQYRAARRLRRRIGIGLAAIVLLLLVALLGVVVYGLVRYFDNATPAYEDPVAHFKYGSIGSEPANGLPYALWQALPKLFPAAFGNRDDYAAFGFIYESDAPEGRRDLPIGISERRVSGIDLVWLNCAICHTGVITDPVSGSRKTVVGMPANQFDLHRFIGFLLEAATSEKLAPDPVFEAIAETGNALGWADRLIWRLIVLPRVREELINRRALLGPLVAHQPAWGPGRVDTFNPYKILQFGKRWLDFAEHERIGTADFPSIFLQAPREGMQLHWDGNNASLKERNLSAAIGAGVTPETVDHPAIERVAEWLQDLPPPPSPYASQPDAVAAGRAIYMEGCSGCHGYQDGATYDFSGDRVGHVEPIDLLGTDAARLDSYTPEMPKLQESLFAGYPEHRFRHFTKTQGYANQPLDGLWLRGPYLHNGSVPTLADLLNPDGQRPATFVRGLGALDPERGGIAASPCEPGVPLETGFCFDTRLPGNGNGGHPYGTNLSRDEKAALLAYLKTF